LRLGVSGEGRLGFAGVTQAIKAPNGVLEFDIASHAAELPFLRLRADGHCRVHWAELV
jgi:hypothetical protein